MKGLVWQLFSSLQSLMTKGMLCSLWNDRAAVTAEEIQTPSPFLSPRAQPAPGLFSGSSLLQELSFIPFLAACTGCRIPAELTLPTLGQCCLRWAAPWGWASLGCAGQNSHFPGAGSCFPPALESPSVFAISPGSQTFTNSQVSFFKPLFFP